MIRSALVLLLTLVCAGCGGDTWEKFTTPDYGPPREDVTVSADRLRGNSKAFKTQASTGAGNTTPSRRIGA